jgi:hypothetical protein
MSRSCKRNPAGGITTARSDKRHKIHTSRVTRHRNKLRLRAGKEVMVLPREAVNQLAAPKDGHKWFGWTTVAKHPEIVRK